MKRIPIAGPWITEKEIHYVTDAVSHGWYENAGKYTHRFESAFATYVGRKYAIALPSCTSGLHLALLCLGIGRSDEVIVPDITWIASSAPITYLQAEPVFADIDCETWCLNPQSLQENFSLKTKAVIVVNLYGAMPKMDAILEIAGQHGIAVIEDAAEAVGSEYHGKKAGSFGIMSVFSFHGSKTLTTGEGGMLVTDEKAIYEKALLLRDHGRPPGDRMFWNTEVAYKYKMSDLQAALGLAQLERIEELIQRKREIFGWYQKQLKDTEGITLNPELPQTKNTYWMVTAVLDSKFGLSKPEVMETLKKSGIDSRPFFHPLSSLPAYRHFPQAKKARENNKVAYRLSPYGINLPSHLTITQEQVAYVCGKLKETLPSPGLAK